MSLRVRLRYSTLVNYASLVYRSIAALGFSIIVARRLSVPEFGLWGILVSVTAMLVTPITLWTFWVQRFHARGWREASGTGLILTLIYLGVALPAYLAVALIENMVIGWGLEYFLLGIPVALFTPLLSYLVSVAAVTKPELIAYANVLNDTLKLATAYALIAVLGARLYGAVVSLELSLLVVTVFLLVLLVRLKSIKITFSVDLVKEWLRGFYVPSLSLAAGFLKSSIRTVVSLAAGSELPVAYLNVGFSAERPLLQSSRAAAPALYTLSLKGRKKEYLEEALRLYIVLSSFLLVTFVVLSRTIASLYNPVYAKAYTVVSAIAFYAFLGGFTEIYETALSGAESIDVKGVPEFRRLLSSVLFKIPLARLLSIAASYGAFTLLVAFYIREPVAIALIVALSLLLGTLATLAYFCGEARSLFPHAFPWREALAAALAGLLVSLYYVFSGAAALEVTRFWSQVPLLLWHLLVGLALYAAAVYTLSPWARKLVRDSISLLRRRLG